MRTRRTDYRVLPLALLLGFCVAAAGGAAAETVTLAKPVPASGKKLDKSKFTGRVVSYDEAGFELRVKAEETETVKWDDLDARTHFVVRKSLLDPKDAAAHLELGRTLLGLKDGKDWAEKSFAVALKIDPKLNEQVAEIKKEAAESSASSTELMKSDKPGDEAGGRIKGGDAPAGPAAGAPEEGASRAGPEMVGGVEAEFWGAQTEEQQAAAVAELKAFAGATQEKMGKPLALNETKYFLFYSDLDLQEAKNWSGLLDRMYGMMAELFGVNPKTNIWRGKGLVFVFQQQRDYVKFQRLMHNTDPGTSIGMCHTYGNGIVHIAFFRQSDELQFAHVLVHESAHGFVHRYKTPARVPSWVNEGLSEWIAHTLLVDKRPNRQKTTKTHAQYWLRQYRGLGGFFDARQIEAWQYPVAEILTTFMLEKNRKGYVAFVNGIKDGQAWEDALKTKYKMTREALVQQFGQALQLRLQ